MEDILNQIADFGDRAHGEQRRKYSPDRYMVHPIRVMKNCQNYTDDISILAAALLHDVLEDTPVSEQEIRVFLKDLLTEDQTERAIKLIVDLTDVYTKEAYPNFNRRTRKEKENDRMATIHPDAQTIKYADIIDNTDEIVIHDPSFAKVFLHECQKNLKRMDRGNPDLYRIAQKKVDNAIKNLKTKNYRNANRI